jgi:uncharacterized small protein (DUF1192 family)
MELLVKLFNNNCNEELTHKHIGFLSNNNIEKNIQELKNNLKRSKKQRSKKNKTVNYKINITTHKSSKKTHNESLLEAVNSNNLYTNTGINNSHTKKPSNVSSICLPNLESPKSRSILNTNHLNYNTNTPHKQNSLRTNVQAAFRNSKEERNMRFMYNKIFTREYQEIISRKNSIDQGINNTASDNHKAKSDIKIDNRKHHHSSNHHNKPKFMQNELIDVKTRILFMKNVFDYTYPKVMVEKLKSMKDIIQRMKANREQKEFTKLINKEKNKTKIILQSSNAFKETNFNKKVDSTTTCVGSSDNSNKCIPVMYHSSSTFFTAPSRPETLIHKKVRNFNTLTYRSTTETNC